jgi:hypothetical protein
VVADNLLDVAIAVLLTENADTMSANISDVAGDPFRYPFLANAVIFNSAEEQADMVASDTISWGSKKDSKEAPRVASRV